MRHVNVIWRQVGEGVLDGSSDFDSDALLAAFATPVSLETVVAASGYSVQGSRFEPSVSLLPYH
jgi:hypothetical protein